jgi:hypothetical protein
MNKIQTDVVSLVKDDNGIFGHLLGNLLRHFWIEQIVKGVDNNIHERHLRDRLLQSRYIPYVRKLPFFEP